MENPREIKEKMKEIKFQINKVKQMKSEQSLSWLYGFIAGLKYCLTGKSN